MAGRLNDQDAGELVDFGTSFCQLLEGKHAILRQWEAESNQLQEERRRMLADTLTRRSDMDAQLAVGLQGWDLIFQKWVKDYPERKRRKLEADQMDAAMEDEQKEGRGASGSSGGIKKEEVEVKKEVVKKEVKFEGGAGPSLAGLGQTLVVAPPTWWTPKEEEIEDHRGGPTVSPFVEDMGAMKLMLTLARGDPGVGVPVPLDSWAGVEGAEEL